jgi:large subunit ribosomal protein L30
MWYLTDKKAKEMGKIKITQIRSQINRPKNQKLTLEALGLRKNQQSVEHEETPQIKGMVDKVKHLVKVENV